MRLDDIEENKKAFADFVDRLNQFYLNIIEYLVFADYKQLPNADTIEAILKTIAESKVTSKCSKDCYLEITAEYRSLLIQILFKNYKMEVKQYLRDWFERNLLETTTTATITTTRRRKLF